MLCIYFVGCKLILKRVHFDRFWRCADKNLVGTNSFNFLIHGFRDYFYIYYMDLYFAQKLLRFVLFSWFIYFSFAGWLNMIVIIRFKNVDCIYLVNCLLNRVKFMLSWKFTRNYYRNNGVATFSAATFYCIIIFFFGLNGYTVKC